MAKKEKKISVKHYLNKKLKPTINSNDELQYRLYIRIRYDGAMTEIKSNYFAYGSNSVTTDDGIHAIISEKEFNKEANQKAIIFEKNAIEAVIRNLTAIYKNPIHELLPSLFPTIASPFINILNMVISYKIQPLIKKEDPIIHKFINWSEFNISVFQKVIKKHFEKDFLNIIISDEEYLKELIEIHQIISGDNTNKNIKLFVPLSTKKNIFQLPERLITSYHKVTRDILHNYEVN